MFEKHGLSQHTLYGRWKTMKQRCYNPQVANYRNYGGRGITMNEGWRNNFKKFYDWCMLNGYEAGLEIDRINNNGNYKPSNCRFVTRITNQQNKRNNKLNWDLVRGIRLCRKAGLTLAFIAECYGVRQQTISEVVHNEIWVIKNA